MKYFFVFLFVLILFASGCDSAAQIDIVSSNSFKKSNLRFNSLLMMDSNNGFIIGSSDSVTSNPDVNSDTFAFVKREALLYKTGDGGKTWEEKRFGEGSLRNISKMEMKLVVIKVSEESLNSYIYSSDDFGDSWNEIGTFPGIASSILFSGNRLYLIGKSQDQIFKLFVSTDFAKSWRPLNVPLPIYNVIACDSKLYYTSSTSKDNIIKNLIVKFDVKVDSFMIYNLPQDYDCSSLINDNGVIRLLGVEKKQITNYAINGNGKITKEYTYDGEENLFPKGYFINGDEEFIVVGKRQNEFVTYKILKSTVKGTKWQSIYFLKNNYIEPFSFIYNDANLTQAWFYSGEGTFQVLNR